MTEESKVRRSGSSSVLGGGPAGSDEEVSIPDYVMLDFADGLVANDRVDSNSTGPDEPPEPELFG